MAAKKYLALIAGKIQRIAAVVVSAGAANDGDLVALNAAGQLDPSVMPPGVGQNTGSGTATEALSAGDVVNVYNVAGAERVRKADGTANGKEVTAFVKAGFANGAAVTYYLPGNVIPGLTGLTPGARQYLSTTPGALTEVPLDAAGNVHQMVGYALSSTTVAFEPEEPVQLTA